MLDFFVRKRKGFTVNGEDLIVKPMSLLLNMWFGMEGPLKPLGVVNGYLLGQRPMPLVER